MRSFSFVTPFTQIDNGVAEGAFLVSFHFFGDFFFGVDSFAFFSLSFSTVWCQEFDQPV